MSLASGLVRLFVERKLPWRAEQWLSGLALVRSYRERRLERWDRALYRPYIGPGDLVFDIGANLGDKAAVFLERGARVVAVEPDARTAATLRKRFSGLSRLQVVEAGVGAAEGQVEFHASPHTTRSTFAVDRMQQLDDGVEYGPGTSVPMTTLDALIAAHGVPRFCKIDVEGYEPEVLGGLTQAVPVLSFEFHGELLDDAYGCIDVLTRLGMSQFNAVLHPIAGHRHQPLNRLYLPRHVSPNDLKDLLSVLQRTYRLAGDIWALSGREAS